VFRYARNGRQRDMGLGSAHTFDLEEARDRARECRKLLAAGVDPIADRQLQRGAARLGIVKAMTFQQCAEAYVETHKASWTSRKNATQWPSSMAAYVYPVIGGLPVQGIETAHIVKVLEPIWPVKNRNRFAGPRPHRERARLGQGSRVSHRREPGPLAWPPRPGISARDAHRLSGLAREIAAMGSSRLDDRRLGGLLRKIKFAPESQRNNTLSWGACRACPFL